MPEDIFYFKESDIPSELPDIPQEVFAPIREGLIAGTLVEIEYENSSDGDSKRQILPEVLFRSSENWYVAAYCMLRDEPRTFRMDRIVSAENTGIEEESAGIAEDYRANGIPWKRSQDGEKTEGAGNRIEWRVIRLGPGENAPECRIPADRPEWERELVMRKLSFDLIRHAGQNELERMSEDIAAGADIDFLDGCGETPFMAAVRGGHLEAAKMLVGLGADPDKRDKVSCTALNEAARFGRMDVIRYLVEELELPVNRQDYYGWTPLSCAVTHDYPEAVSYFLEHGADVNLADKDGCTPLMIAARRDLTDEISLKMAEQLLVHGADVNRKDKKGQSALSYACASSKWEGGVGFLAKAGADFQVCDKSGASLLLRTAKKDVELPWHELDFPLEKSNEARRDMDLARYLIAHGVNPNLPDKYGVVPAMAVTGDFLKLLLESGANPSASDVLGRTAAMYHTDLPDDILLLRDFGADICRKDIRGNDVLLCGSRTLEHIRFLIETFGFSVNDRNDDGLSILHRVSHEFFLDSVEYLLRLGASPAVRTKDGRTPLDVLHENWKNDPHPSPSKNYAIIANLYEDILKKETSNLFDACRDMDFRRIRDAVGRGASVHRVLRRDGNRTVLTLAAARFSDPGNGISWMRFLRIYLYLKADGADIFAVDDEGNSVLNALKERNCQGSVRNYMRTVETMIGKMPSVQAEKLYHYLKRKRKALVKFHGGRGAESVTEIIRLINRLHDV